MQAGSVFALEDRDWIFPAYRESAIGLLRGMPVSTVLSWWRGHPAGWWNPRDYNVASICVPIATQIPHAVGLRVGLAAEGRGHRRADPLRRRRDLGRRVPRGRDVRGRDEGAGDPLLQQQPVGDLDPARPSRRRHRRWPTRRSATASPACASTAATCSPCTRRPATRFCARVPATARRSSRPSRTGPRRTRRRTTRRSTSIPSAWRSSARTSASAASSATCERLGVLADEQAEAVKAEALELMRAGIAEAEAEPPADPSLVFEHAYADPPPSLLARPGRSSEEDPGRCLSSSSSRRSTTRCTSRWSATIRSWSWARTSGRSAASSARPRACRSGSAPIAASTRRSPRPGSSAPPSGCAWRAGGRSARCSTTRSAIRRSTS